MIDYWLLFIFGTLTLSYILITDAVYHVIKYEWKLRRERAKISEESSEK